MRTLLKKQRGRPRLSRASSTKVDGPPNATKPVSSKPPEQTESKAKQTKTAEKQRYKAEMQKYLRDRVRQGKAEIKLDASIKQLEAKIKAMKEKNFSFVYPYVCFVMEKLYKHLGLNNNKIWTTSR